MTLLTAVDIKAQLDGVSFANPIKEINAFVRKNEARRKYTSIDIENITGQEETEDVPTTTTKQTFLVHLYVKNRSSGDADESIVKTFEDEIFNSIDALQTTDTKVLITQSWDRTSDTFPVVRVHSVLRVTSEEISSTDGSGVKGDDVTITLPDPVGELKVIDILTDEAGIIQDLDLETNGKRVHTKIRNDGLLSVVVAIDVAKQNEIKTMIFAGDNISVTITKGGTPDARIANLNNIIGSGNRGKILTQILEMDIEY